MWRVLVGHLRAVGCAAALALARVLAFAAIVARFTSALALSPSCPLGPDRTGLRNACRREGWTPGSLWWYRRASLRALRQRLGPSLTLSFSRITSCEFGLQPHLLLLRCGRWFWIAANGFSGLGWFQAPAVTRGFARSITPRAWPDNFSFSTQPRVRIRSAGSSLLHANPTSERSENRAGPLASVGLRWNGLVIGRCAN
jgi:hypothetical protein